MQGSNSKKLGAIIFCVIAVIYCVSPIDIIPDAIPIAGWIDDGGILFAAIMLYRQSCRYAKVLTAMQQPLERKDLPVNTVNVPTEVDSKTVNSVTSRDLDLF